MSPLGLKLLSALVCDESLTVVRDESKATVNGRLKEEVIRVRMDGCDYDVKVEVVR